MLPEEDIGGLVMPPEVAEWIQKRHIEKVLFISLGNGQMNYING